MSSRTFVAFLFLSSFSSTGLPSIVTHSVRSSVLSFQALESLFYGTCLKSVPVSPFVHLASLSGSHSAR